MHGAGCSKGAREPWSETTPPDFADPQWAHAKEKLYLKKKQKIIIYFKNIGFPLQVDVSASVKVGKIGLQVDASSAPKSGR